MAFTCSFQSLVQSNFMEDLSQIARKLSACGLRPSAPRKALLAHLQACGTHPTPYELLDAFKAQGRPISIATLYQNLQVLSEAGLIRKFVDSEGTSRYDANLGVHHHLHCTSCGRILDIEVPEALLGSLSALGQAEGWQVSKVQLDLDGLCDQCQGQETLESA